MSDYYKALMLSYPP